MKTQHYRPAEGRRVRKPNGDLLSGLGEPIELTPYFRRLLDDGDIEACAAPKAEKE